MKPAGESILQASPKFFFVRSSSQKLPGLVSVNISTLQDVKPRLFRTTTTPGVLSVLFHPREMLG